MLRRIAIYFGFVKDPEPGPLDWLRASMLRGRVLLPVSVAFGLAARAGFDWSVGNFLAGTAVGAVAFGIAEYVLSAQKRIPRGPLPEPPADAEWERMNPRVVAGRIFFALPSLAGLALALHDWHDEFISVFLPGQLIGMTVADLVAARQLSHWEREHHTRVAFRVVDGEERFYGVRWLNP
jgi:hypothetical protein